MSETKIREIISKYRVVAVVGISADENKPSYRVSAYLIQQGYEVIPVNPTIDQVLGQKSYKNLLDIPPEIAKTIEIVDIFRKAQDVPPIVDQAIQLKQQYGAPYVIWMQLGIVNEQAAEKAQQAGLTVIMDRCLMVEHDRLT